MSWIEHVPGTEAAGLPRAHFDTATERAGHVSRNVNTMHLNPGVAPASISFDLGERS
jgi:hypothetical protein